MAGTAKQISLAELAQWCNGVPSRLADLEKPITASRIAIVADTKRNFAEGCSPTGDPWPGLSGLTLGARRTGGGKGGAKPLRDWGFLMSSVTAPGADGNVNVQTPTSLVWGTNLEYARIHQKGGKIRPVNAKALAVPLTTEARNVGSPLNFPKGRLKFIRPNAEKIGKVRGYFYEQVGWVKALGKGKSKGRRGTGGREYAKQPIVKEASEGRIFHYLLTTQVDIPARPFLGWSQELVKTVQNIFKEFLGKALE